MAPLIRVDELCLPPFTIVSCSAYSSILKIEAIFSSETSADIQRTTRLYIPENSTLHDHRCENLKFYINYTIKTSSLNKEPADLSSAAGGYNDNWTGLYLRGLNSNLGELVSVCLSVCLQARFISSKC
jgi:hypothetical protein